MINVNKELFRWGPIPGRFFYMSEFLSTCYKHFGEKYDGHRWPETLLMFKDGQMVWINQMEDLYAKGQEIFLKYMLNQESRNKIYQEWQKCSVDLLEFQKELDSINLSELSDEELGKKWEQFFQLTINFWVEVVHPELSNYGSENVLKAELKKFISTNEEFNSTMEILAAPEKPSFYQEEEIDLAETDDLEKHQKRYFWLHNSYAGTKVLSKEFFVGRKNKVLNNIRELTKKKFEETKQRKEEVRMKYGLSNDCMKIANAISENIVWQDERKGHLLHNMHYKTVLLQEVAKRFGYNFDNLLNAFHNEIKSIISGKDLKEELIRRREGFGFNFTEDYDTLSSQETSDYWEKYVQEKVEENMNEFKGTIASKGKNSIVKGKARVIFDPFEAKDFQEGDILITPMTSPEFVFLMKKSLAIITDTGGLTCHAAILSREFQIPCIVGTKVATQVLKDGDVVEVDANTGVVKKVINDDNTCEDENEINLPTEQQCLDYFKEYKVPKNIKQHCLNVRNVAMFLAKKVRESGIDVNIDFVDRLALLHDLFKIVSIKSLEPNKYHAHQFSEEEIMMREKLQSKFPGLHECDVAYETFKGKYPKLALALKNVSISNIENKNWEEGIVHYADWRIAQNKIVSLQYRLDYLQELYPKPKEYWQTQINHIKELENKIMGLIKIDPNELEKAFENGR
jgi:phosphohistidine swiveling domain-containing protein